MLVRRARAADPREPHVDLDRVVEDRRRVVLDRKRTHHELVPVEQVGTEFQVAVVLDSREVEVRQVPAVVDDPLRVRVGEADPGAGGVLERRHAVGDEAELERHRP